MAEIERMRRLRNRIGLGLLTVLASVGSLLITTQPAVADPSGLPAHGQWTVYGGDGSGSSFLTGISCPVHAACLGVGTDIAFPSRLASALVASVAFGRVTFDAPPNGSTLLPVTLACTSVTHCMAVGGRQTQTGVVPFAQLWNGTSWRATTVVTPRREQNGVLGSIACLRISFCLAVGSYMDLSGLNRPLSETWNGRAWRRLRVPTPGPASLVAVSCASTNRCMAVGTSSTSTNTHAKPVAYSWTGSRWVRTTPPPAAATGTETDLMDVACAGARACTAVGSAGTDGVVETWDGSSWHRSSPISMKASTIQLTSVSCLQPTLCVVFGSEKSGLTTQVFAQLLQGRDRRNLSFDSVPNANGSSTFTDGACFLPGSCIVVGGDPNNEGGGLPGQPPFVGDFTFPLPGT